MDPSVHPPPRLLLGASLLLWGAITGNPLLALATALLLESAHWTHLRWPFTDLSASRAWRLCMLLTLITGSLIWLEGDTSARYTALPRLIIWLPLLLLPLQFVQSFGNCKHMALNSFSFFSKLRRERNRHLGLPDSIIHFNFGNLYFLTTIIASCLGQNAQEKIFLPGIIILIGWLIHSRIPLRPIPLLILITLATALAITGQIALRTTEQYLRTLTEGSSSPGTDTTENRTAIGSLGQIKQSSAIKWRIIPHTSSPPPTLLRLASYNLYKGVSWKKSLPPQRSTDQSSFRDLKTTSSTAHTSYYLIREEMDRSNLSKKLPSFTLRGAAKPGDPLPLPGNAATLREFDLDGIEINPLGTTRIFPKKSIIGGDIRWEPHTAAEAPPWPDHDLQIPEAELATITHIATTLGLTHLPTPQAKIARLRQWFQTEFHYTRYLTISPHRTQTATAIGIFLTSSKRGHCEYFATAATLILRAAGVPTRYCVGYSVTEKDPAYNQYIIRGTHGHAWTRAWDGSTWIDYDATPPGWLTAETSSHPESLWLSDTYTRLKEDFFLWRNRPQNRLTATIIIWSLGLSTLTFIAIRLWKSKTPRHQKTTTTPHHTPPTHRTPLHTLERPATRILGHRPPGQTLATYLTRLSGTHLPPTQLATAITLHQRCRFDSPPPPPADLTHLHTLTTQFIKILKTTPTPQIPNPQKKSVPSPPPPLPSQ